MTRLLNCLIVAVPLLLCQPAQLTELEREFEASMINVVLEGQATRDGKPGAFDDKYIVEKVAKQSGDTWTFHVRIAAKGQTVTMPFPILIKWAGDTPVITITDQALPGMGTYTARVLLYRGHYAGTWSGKSSGGKIFGRIVKSGP